MLKQTEKLTEQMILKSIAQLQDNISLRINQVDQQLGACAMDDDFHSLEQELELLDLECRILGEIRDDASRATVNRRHNGVRSIIEICLQTELDKPAMQTDRQAIGLAAEQLDEQAAILLDGFSDDVEEDTALKAKADLFKQLAENVRENMPERRAKKRKATSGATFDTDEVLKLA